MYISREKDQESRGKDKKKNLVQTGRLTDFKRISSDFDLSQAVVEWGRNPSCQKQEWW